MITFALTAETLSEQIYALSALHNILHTPQAVPPALNRDHAPALAQAIEYAFGRVCAALAPIASDCDSVDGSYTLTLSADLGTSSAGMRQGAVRRLLEQAVVSEVLAAAYLNYDSALARTYADAAAATLSSLRSALLPLSTPRSHTARLSIRPHS